MATRGAPRVGLRDLKALVRAGRDEGDPVSLLILSQPDELPVDVFLARVDDWLHLSKIWEGVPDRRARRKEPTE